MKKVVVILDKTTKTEAVYGTVKSLVETVSSAKLGICLGALYNALSISNNEWENKRYKVYYKYVNMKPQTWE